MSYAACKLMHPATGIDNCASGFITHSPADVASRILPVQTEDVDAVWPATSTPGVGPIPNLIVTAANVLEVYTVRVQEDGNVSNKDSATVLQPQRGGLMAGLSGASLELVCSYRLHGNVESVGVLYSGAEDRTTGRRRDSIILTFRDAKISVLEFDDSVHGLRTSSMHCFEGPKWLHLKKGRECFARGPLIKVDPLGRCAGVLVYGLQMIMLKASEAGGLVGDDGASSTGGSVSARVQSSYLISLRDLDVKHVKDFIFVHGYIEPVLVLLHEKELTWAGRLPYNHHTCIISALSISTTLKQHPLIWSATNLPHDAHKLLAVPSPIGGVLVVCANTVHYHSQSTSCILALNNYAVPMDSSQEMSRSSFSVELDAANTTWLSNDVAMLSTKTGELLLLTLVHDGRIVQKLDLSKAKASVLTSGITTIGSSFFFLGSRLGDSLLVQFYCGAGSSIGVKEEIGDIEGDIPSTKRLRRSSSDALQDMANDEELSLYGSDLNNAHSSQKSFSFTVRDSFINVGPLKDFSYGLRMNADSNATGVAKQSNYELVCCSGHGKNGALCVLQRSIRPEIITQEAIPGCKGLWTVYHKNSRNQAEHSKIAAADDEYHAYLIISLESRTMVLQTVSNLEEVTENVDYFVQGSTIYAGNLFGRRRVIQVYARGARILDGAFMTQDITFPATNSEAPMTVSSVSIADPYVLLMMTDGSIQLLVGDPSTCKMTINNLSAFQISKKSITACTLYHDKGTDPWLRKTSTDAWLLTGVSEPVEGPDGAPQDQGDIYCAICYESGTLEIYDVPNFCCVYTVHSFVSGRNFIGDNLFQDSSEKIFNNNSKDNSQNMKVVELAMHRWHGENSRPFLFGILTDGTILCYHAYLYEGSENASRSESVNDQSSLNLSGTSASRLKNLRFSRVPLDTYTREEMSAETPFPRMNMFKNVGGYPGFFLSGSRPTWFMKFRERLRIHPQLCDGPIIAFTVLHNMYCNHGFIYVTSQGSLKICQLPSLLSYDNYWPVQKIPLKATPHQVTYFAEKNLYPLIVSVPVAKPINQVLSTLVDQEAGHQIEHENSNIDGTYTVEEFEVRIMEPESSGGPWQMKGAIHMQTSENALTVRVVTLTNTTTRENETLLAIGTAYVQGEDVAARGRVLLYSVESSTESVQSKITEVYAKEMKGAISALASIQGYLLVASGPKVILHKWTGSELNGVAFFDAPPLYVVSLNIVKNFILLGDIHKSIYFLSWKESASQLTLLAKDFGSLDCLATEFLIDGSTLSLMVSDYDKNVQVSESWKGQKLLSRAEFHVGSHATKFLRLQMLPASDRPNAPSGSDKTNRFALLFGTLDGSIGCIAPLDELTFRRLQSLQKKLVDAVPHVAGLNPRSFRQFHSNGKAHRPGPDSIVDCELLCHYDMLPFEHQHEIANQIGTTRSQIISNLNDLAVGTSFL
ncbi:cleavage and polyadenylation specificity factor subunit 1 isoform X2 [Rutidosis leptorrhynchoides]|uniref:cleavage and polyadenylation specificity factor subunit 1 isoform X2 n=1 Tax=Rutidosis leptorrhynchoides TaxID=125765 RepID=UPI003A98EB0F